MPDPGEGAPAAGVLVTGARGVIGPYLIARLRQQGRPVQAVSRRAAPAEANAAAAAAGVAWAAVDLAGPPSEQGLRPAAALVHAAPLWLLPPWLATLAGLGVRRVVAIGSTSRVTRQRSSSAAERALARRLAEAEDALSAGAQVHGLRWTLLRPSLVYAAGRDRNVGDIARFVSRYGFFPVAGAARGRRQPVHAADLADAAAAVLDNQATFDRAYDVPGGETLTYEEMVRRIARGLGRRPRLVHLPLPLLRGLASAARLLPRWRHLSAAMAERMNEDLVFDAGAARRDFGWAPRRFAFPDAADQPLHAAAPRRAGAAP